MRIVATYSHLHGREFLQVHKPNLIQEIESAIDAVDASRCRNKVSKEKRTHGKVFYSPIALNNAMKREFQGRGWKEKRTSYWVTSDAELTRRTMQMTPDEQRQEIARWGKTPIPSFNQTDFVKDRVAIEVQFGKYTFVAFDLFVKHMAFFIANVVDVGVEILPMKELQRHMSSGVACYERELYNLIREGRGVPAVPLILLGVAP